MAKRAVVLLSGEVQDAILKQTGNKKKKVLISDFQFFFVFFLFKTFSVSKLNCDPKVEAQVEKCGGIVFGSFNP